MSAKKENLMRLLQKKIIDNNVCSDLAESANQLVLGEGNLDADILFVGEAPGKNEDEQGRPFVGAAGKFLEEMLNSIGLVRDDVYITNIVKYRPPNNRDPLPEEKKAFLPYLFEQIKIIQPKVIVTLGRHAMEAFLPNYKISNIHGQPKRIKGQIILPLYHPAAALYNGSMRATLMEDFLQIPRTLKAIEKGNYGSSSQ